MRKEKKLTVFATILTISALFTLILCNNAKPALAADSFSDTGGRWSELVIEKCYALDLMNGYPDGTFKPDDPVSRLEAIAITLNAMGKKQEALNIDYQNSEIELPPGMTWGQGYLVLAVRENLLRADIAPRLQYKNPIPRQEIAALFVAALWDKIRENRGVISELNFIDLSDIGPDYLSYVADICHNGIMQGLGNNEFGPRQNMKREHMAALLVKTMQDGWFDTGAANIITGVIKKLDLSEMTISITRPDGSGITRPIKENAPVYKDAGESTLNDLMVGDAVTAITGKTGSIIYIESSGDAPSVDIVIETTLTGKIIDRASTADDYLKIRDCGYQEHIFALADNVNIMEGTADKDVSALTDDTYVNVKIKNNAISSIRILQASIDDGEVFSVEPDSFTIKADSGKKIIFDVRADRLKISGGDKKLAYSELKTGARVKVISVFGEAQEVIYTDITLNNAQIRTVDPEYRIVALLNLDNNIRKEYEVEPDAVIRKGILSLPLENLKQGDFVRVGINAGGKISEIYVQTEGEQDLTGTVTWLTTGSFPEITIDKTTYDVSPQVYVIKESGTAYLSDIMLGSVVNLTLGGDNTVTGIEITADTDIWIEGEAVFVSGADSILIEQENGLQFTIPVSSRCTFSDQVSDLNITKLSEIRSGWVLNIYLNSSGEAEQIKVTGK